MLFSGIIKKKFDAVLGRYDGDPAMRYPSMDDFPDLKSLDFDVPGDSGITLRGWIYSYGDPSFDKLIVFDHGIGAGHRAYLAEIDRLASRGYAVYSYDHTGCVLTGGKGIMGFAQGINDLDHVIDALRADPRTADTPIKLVGHSWGGYASMNVTALHPEVTHVVSLAGFLSARSLVEQYIPKAFLRYSDEVMDRERVKNPRYADMDARESLAQSQAKLLHLQSKDDQKVLFGLSCELLREALDGRPGTDFIVVDHRGHDPHRTDAAARAIESMTSELEQGHKKKRLETASEQEAFQASHDWNLIVEQDPEIWEKIFAFLES